MKTHLLSLIVVGVSIVSLAETSVASGPLSESQREMRLEHAQELMGSVYGRSVVRTGEQIKKVNGSIYRWTRTSLPKKFKNHSDKLAQVIIDEAHRYGFDPIFLLAVIQTESSFNPSMIGGVGEIGLMQIRPETAEWITKKTGLKWTGAKSLHDPATNVRIGCAYLNWLREKFDSHARLYLAAYNMGQNNVRELLQQDKWPKEYPSRVMQNYVTFYEDLKTKT